jgi:16S rRNA (uracil1498-N3)-methyltransferase
MALPLFYTTAFNPLKKEIVLDEDTSRHVVQVLRIKRGKSLNLTDGKGNLVTASLIDDHKKHASVQVDEVIHQPQTGRSISIGISLLKNTSRFEWFLEKAIEIGVNRIVPLICERTEKEKFRMDRLQGICISAMLQSQQTWLPELLDPVGFRNCFNDLSCDNKFIGSCDDTIDKINLSSFDIKGSASILIGPEGDFTGEELKLAIEQDYKPVSLGQTRLRTETAGIVAVTLLQNR